MPIRNCTDKKTERFLAGERVKEFQSFHTAATKALTKLIQARVLGDLRNPPSNVFEALGGNRKGQYSIRINGQYRVCFKWMPFRPDEGLDALLVAGEPYDVEITDYH